MSEVNTRDHCLNFEINLIHTIVGVPYQNEDNTLEKEKFVKKYQKELDEKTSILFNAMHDVIVGDVKVFRINKRDLIAAKSLEDAVHWYKENFASNETNTIESISEIADLKSYKVTLKCISPKYLKYSRYEVLQNKYAANEQSTTFTVPGDELLLAEWNGVPYLFDYQK
ncbi:hypothetical protein MKX73_19325 [Solibacillus sp. FSL W7-1436]|uniref:hypothetical protein n=1 Tax=Solibacillus sp. FSL W7-1436 TaxID=2921705 RepID=UPI0030F7BDDB